jgi:hypothetical protein
MTDPDSIFNAADALAKFSNIEPNEIDAFYSAHPDFMPDLRKYVSIVSEPGKPSRPSIFWLEFVQRVLRKAWLDHFDLDGAVRLIAVFDDLSKSDAVMDRLLMPPASETQQPLTAAEYGLLERKVWPFQHAVMFLTVNSWRARFCTACGKRFVASNPKGRFCNDTCFQRSLKNKKLQWWREHGNDLRRKKKK